MANTYSALLSALEGCSAESQSTYDFLTERHLQVMWYERKYFRNLISSNNETIEIISPGIWNNESGPDFLKAHLKIGNKEIQGDVEIHFVDESWVDHQHNSDPRYNQVILNISLWRSKNERPLHTSKGKEIARAYLENCFTISPSRIVQLIDLDLYPYKQFLGSGRCAQALFKGLSNEKIEHLFGIASEWRLSQKHRYLEARLTGFALQLLGGIAMSLGYKANPETFLDLFISLLPHQTMPEEELIALSLGVCGFFDDFFKRKWEKSDEYQKLLSRWNKLALHATKKYSLRLDHIRPLNHPVRRLIYLIKLLKDTSLANLYNLMSSKWSSTWTKQNDKKKWRDLQHTLREMIPNYQDPYWNHHFTFETQPKGSFLTLMGDDLRNTILFNTFLPLLHQEIVERKDPFEKKAFLEFYKTFNTFESGKIRYLSHRFFGDTEKSSLLRKAQMAQGALQLHKDFCLRFEASCVGCPFVERYKALF